MKTITNIQKEFLLEYFFKNEKYAGWRNIAIKLIEGGECIVAGDECIWRGGVGNFINVVSADNLFNCSKYSFDLEYFLTSNWFKEIHNQYISILSAEKRDIEQRYEEICDLYIITQ